MGVITGYSRRTAAIGSGGGGAINTIYSGSDTITDDARTVTLKSGGTASQNLQFLNSGGGNLLQLKGNNSIDFGSNANGVLANFYLKSGSDTFNIYGSNNTLSTRIYGNFNSTTNAHLWQYRSNGAETLHIWNYDDGQLVEMKGDNTNTFSMRGRTVNHGMTIETVAGYAGLYSFTIKGYKTDNTPSMFLRGNDSGGFYAFGAASTEGTYRMEIYGSTLVKGSGSTSATTTALFQNSSSVAALKVKDDLYCIFRAKNAVIPDGDLANNELSFYIEEATNDLHFKVKYSTGTVKIGKVNLI